MGCVLVLVERHVLRVCADVAEMDASALTRRPANVCIMESLNALGIRLYFRGRTMDGIVIKVSK